MTDSNTYHIHITREGKELIVWKRIGVLPDGGKVVFRLGSKPAWVIANDRGSAACTAMPGWRQKKVNGQVHVVKTARRRERPASTKRSNGQ
jgi:hypothetical protein